MSAKSKSLSSLLQEGIDYNYVNPKHYQMSGVEVIEMMRRIWGNEATAKHCEMCAFKYRMRIGSKPNQPIGQELAKAKWYEQKAKEFYEMQ